MEICNVIYFYKTLSVSLVDKSFNEESSQLNFFKIAANEITKNN